MYNCESKRTWKFLSAAALTYDRSFVSACGVMVGKLVVVVVTVCVCVCVGGRAEGGYNGRLMKARGFTEMAHEVAVQLMLQLCSKDSPAVLRISPCAYVIRIHGTAARPGASDPGECRMR